MKKTLTLVLILSLVLGLFVAFPAFAEEEAFNGAEITGITWVNGTRYGGAEPGNGNGKYICTTIPVVPGDKVKIELGGVWNLWLYTGVGGSVPSQYTGTYRGGNSTRKINNGEVFTFPEDVTELHITVYIEGGAEATVESEAFKTLDIKFYKEAAVVKEPYRGAELTLDWKGGAFYHTAEPNTALATTRKYDVIPCAEGDVISVVSPSNGWKVWIYPADENGSIEGKYYGLENGGTYTVEAINGKMPTALRITTHLQPDAVIADDAWAARDLVILSDRIIEEEPPATSDASTVALALTAFAALAVVTGVVVLRKRTVRG